MGKILIVFGSTSDAPVYNEIAKHLENVEVRALSAHRTPSELLEVLKNNQYDVIIAGAGLAAHLPGVVASKVVTPIIGVPCNSNYDGLDSLLSVIQMPPGIPVLTVGIDCAKQAAKYAELMRKEYSTIVIVGDQEHKRVQKCVDILKEFNVNIEFRDETSPDVVNIRFVKFEDIIEDDHLTINVLLKKENTARDTLDLLEFTKKGLWVGLNRGDNAALGAIAILKKFDDLRAYREKMKQKVLEADKNQHESNNV